MVKQTKAGRVRRKEAGLTCRRVTSFILDYVTSDLHRDTATGLEAHLRACPDCVAFLETYKKTMALTQSFLRERTRIVRRQRGGRLGRLG